MNIKFGIDPTGTSLHLGHLVILNALKNEQKKGNIIDIIIGDFTAKIGDPTGKNKTRPSLSENEIKINSELIKEQLFLILDKNKTRIHFNSEWLKTVNIIELMSLFTVQQIMERNDFKDRFQSNSSISLSEFVYPLLQGIDSFFLKSEMEFGGTDQLFNLNKGREIQIKKGIKPQNIKMFPILNGLDGFKMSKSLNNCIFLTESHLDIFSKIMSISDTLMNEWIEAFNSCFNEKMELEKIENFFFPENLHPKEKKKNLAVEILSMFNNSNPHLIKKEWEKIHELNILDGSIPELIFSKDIKITDFLKINSVINSKNEVIRLIKQNAIKLNSITVTDIDKLLEEGILTVGKKIKIKILRKGDFQ